jgi:hypothetical protein
MTNSLAEIRAKLLAQDKKKGGSGGYDNAIYAHWNTPENETSTIRFLPDSDTTNDFFWRERQTINLTFSGVKGGEESKPVTVKVPCIEMWEGPKCPIQEEIRPWFKDPTMEDMARKYWKKRSYIMQGLVVESAFAEEEVPETPVRRFILTSQIFKLIHSALMDPDFGDELPTDYDGGVDFRVTKTKSGQYASYTTSSWARKSRSLNQDERDGITTHGLFDLNDFMPKKPSAEELKIIFEMFESSLEGELYDPARFAEYYRPYGVEAPTSGASTRTAHAPKPATPAATPAASSANDEAPAAAAPAAASGGKDAKDILAAIRARKEAS